MESGVVFSLENISSNFTAVRAVWVEFFLLQRGGAVQGETRREKGDF